MVKLQLEDDQIVNYKKWVKITTSEINLQKLKSISSHILAKTESHSQDQELTFSDGISGWGFSNGIFEESFPGKAISESTWSRILSASWYSLLENFVQHNKAYMKLLTGKWKKLVHSKSLVMFVWTTLCEE